MSRPGQESAGQAVGEQRSRMSTRVLSLDLWCRCSARKIEEAPKPHFGKLSKTHGGGLAAGPPQRSRAELQPTGCCPQILLSSKSRVVKEVLTSELSGGWQ